MILQSAQTIPTTCSGDTPPLASVIIVNYNGGRLLTDCVNSVLASTVPIEVLVSDNGSTDCSLADLRQARGHDSRLKILENKANLGFARANNLALPASSGSWLLFLNPDCLIAPDTVARMIDAMKTHPKAGMAGCLIRNPDGSEQPGCRRRTPTPDRALATLLGIAPRLRSSQPTLPVNMTGEPLPDKPVSVEAISGAFMFVRRQALEQVGPLDDGYFLHCEDLDWCMRFQQADWHILFVPDVTITHVKGTCSTATPVAVEWHKHRGMLRFYRKFFRRRYSWTLWGMVVLGVWLHFMAMAGLLFLRKIFRPHATKAPCTPIGTLPTEASEVDDRPEILVTGATNQIGYFLLPLLTAAGYRVHAISRAKIPPSFSPDPGIVRHQADLRNGLGDLAINATTLIHLAPLDLLAPLLEELAGMGIGRVVAFSSTSRFSKKKSTSPKERQTAAMLANCESQIAAMCRQSGISWTIFQPTMIYGCGRDRNVTTIARVIRTFRIFPLAGKGLGLRQPVHAADLASACLAVLSCPAAANRTYILSGGQTMAYRQLVETVFHSMGKKPKFFTIPVRLLRMVLTLLALLPGFRHLSPEMADRMDTDLVFDHQDASRDFAFTPRPFQPAVQPRK